MLGLISCESNTDIEKPVRWSNESSIELNKAIMEEEEINIKLFLAQHSDWNMKKTGSGLRYMIYKAGDGDLGKKGETAMVSYKISLLDGTVCYETEEDEYREYKIDHSDIETGVQEALKLLHVGDHSKLIIPSHIAHGLTGDMNKIPPLSTLVIDLHLIGLKK